MYYESFVDDRAFNLPLWYKAINPLHHTAYSKIIMSVFLSLYFQNEKYLCQVVFKLNSFWGCKKGSVFMINLKEHAVSSRSKEIA